MHINSHLVMPTRGWAAYMWQVFDSPRSIYLLAHNAVFNLTYK